MVNDIYRIERAASIIAKELGNNFTIDDLLVEAEQGKIAIGFRNRSPAELQHPYLFIDHRAIKELQEHRACDIDYVYFDERSAREASTYFFKNPRANSPSELGGDIEFSSITLDDLIATKSEVSHYLATVHTPHEYCSYHDCGHILFEKPEITPCLRERELEIWSYIDSNNLQLYLDKGLTKRISPKGCREMGLSIESCYFAMRQVLEFNPNDEENTGRWLTFEELHQRWCNLTPRTSPESIYNLIVSTHNKTVAKKLYLLHPLSGEDELFAVSPYSDVAEQAHLGMYQLRQVEKFEEHYFKKSKAKFTPPTAIGYEAAYRFLDKKYKCSPEEFTVWCRWNHANLQPYKDKDLQRPFSLLTEEVDSLGKCLAGTYFNKNQVEDFYPKDRYITYKNLVEKIMVASGYDKEKSEWLIKCKFEHDGTNGEAPDEISENNTLGMNWTYNFKDKLASNAAYNLNNVEQFLNSYFQPESSGQSCENEMPRLETAPPSEAKPKRTRVTLWHMVVEEFFQKSEELPQINEVMNHLKSLADDGHSIIQEVTPDRQLIYVQTRSKPIKRVTVANLVSKLRKKILTGNLTDKLIF